jgi:hypothetical protein
LAGNALRSLDEDVADPPGILVLETPRPVPSPPRKGCGSRACISGPGTGYTGGEKIRLQPELENMPLLLQTEFQNIALLVQSLPVLIGLTGLKANGVTADTAFWQPMRVS